jgi:hypothetical protein
LVPAAAGAPGPARILAESAAAWARLWTSDIVVPGQPALPGRVRVAQFYLLAAPARTSTGASARSLAPYELQAPTAGAGRTVATVPATADMADKISFAPVAGDAVRLPIPATRFGGQDPGPPSWSCPDDRPPAGVLAAD